MNAQEQARATRAGAGLFRLEQRGLLRVAGRDRVRWLDGMLSNDVTGLSPGSEHSGCYAALLTRQGRIVADFHVLLREDSYWLETARPALAVASETLARFIVADDVTLADASDEVERLALEGPAAAAVLEAAAGRGLPLADDACGELELAGASVVAAAFGWSGAPARQLFVPAGSGERVAALLLEAGCDLGLVAAEPEALEILRVEAGVPRLFAELGPDVLPAEARLTRAVSTTKGCYTGQEVVARMHSRGRVGHLLVGIRLGAADPPLPAPGAEILVDGGKVGELTSACLSPAEGAIGLGFVRAARAEPGTPIQVGGRDGVIAELPFAVARGA